jgi:hypothetical protein
MIQLAQIEILKNCIGRIQLFGQLNLIGCVVRKLTIKELFLGVAHWHFLLSELCPQKCQSIGFHSETANCATPINLTADGCSDRAHAFECTHTVPLFPLAMLCTAEGPLSN